MMLGKYSILSLMRVFFQFHNLFYFPQNTREQLNQVLCHYIIKISFPPVSLSKSGKQNCLHLLRHCLNCLDTHVFSMHSMTLKVFLLLLHSSKSCPCFLIFVPASHHFLIPNYFNQLRLPFKIIHTLVGYPKVLKGG